LLGRGLCDELITRPEESYRMWFGVSECDREAMLKKQKVIKSRRKGRPMYFEGKDVPCISKERTSHVFRVQEGKVGGSYNRPCVSVIDFSCSPFWCQCKSAVMNIYTELIAVSMTKMLIAFQFSCS